MMHNVVPSTSVYDSSDVYQFDLPTVMDAEFSDSSSNEMQNLSFQKKSSPSKSTYKTLPKNQLPPTCFVCRNQAIGYHYDVPSCNGCKTFFRRTIMNGRQYVCPKENNCIPEGVEPLDMSKRICRACRFEKCVQAGMNPLAIQAEVKSKEGKILRDEVLKKRSSDEELSIAKKFTTFEERVNQAIEELLFIESRIEPLHQQGLPPGYRDFRTLEEIVQSSPIFSVHEIPNLVYAAPRVCSKTGEIKVRLTNYTHSSFLATIEYSKTFSFNENIDMESKLALLKHGTNMCSALMNSFFSVHYLKSDKLVNPDGSLAGPPGRKSTKCGDIYKTEKELLQKTLIALLRLKIERIEYILLKAIALCNPAVKGLTPMAQKAIEKDRQKFTQCLFSYCMYYHGKVDGPSRFMSLIAITTVIENQQKHQKDIHTFIKALHYAKHKPSRDPYDKKVSVLFDEIMGS